MLNEKANSLEKAIPNLDHTRSLRVDELDTFYVERKEVNELLNEMRVQLELQYPCKGLLTGHRGSGKSSTLAKLGHILNQRKRLWVVQFSLLDGLDLNDLSYVDIIFMLAVKILERCEEQQLDLDGFDKRLQAWANEIEIVKQEGESLEASAEAKAELSTPNLGWLTLPVKAMLSVGGKVGKESSTRKTIREQIEPEFTELLGIIDDLQHAIFKRTEKRLICLIDGSDKASIESAENLFYKNGHYLSAPECSIIYTFPVALQNSQNFQQMEAYFADAFTLANFKVQHRADQETNVAPDGMFQLKEVITRRLDYSLFEGKALENLVFASGGIPRTAIMLTQKAAIKALARAKDKISEEHVAAAIAEERRDFDRQLSKKQRELLKLVSKTNKIDSDPEAGYLDLLHNLSVIEYVNGDAWYGVSPLAAELLDS